ncbi:S1C family serine protease [Streptomyces sp. NPDC002889]|uniref:S1C family serine protease n=1 Tax=Streptomyces sp. NPDC002889 TaxID=3364669 RepID=UPI0036C67D4A
MTDHYRRDGEDDGYPPQTRDRRDGGGGFSPPPPCGPARPPVTVWPGDGVAGYPPPFDGPVHSAAPQPAPAHRARAKRPVGLITAAAVAAALIGGGASVLVGEYYQDHSVGVGNSVPGTTVARSDKGTVAGVAEAVSPSIVEISAASTGGKSTGSGVIITKDGEIVTNNHVIVGASAITVRLSSGKTYDAEIVGTDAAKDLALIKLDDAPAGLPTATLGDSGKVRVGDGVVAIGSPEGLTGTVTSGIISALERDVTVAKDQDPGRQQPREGWPFEFGGQEFNGDTGESTTTYKALQTDASLNPGNSGGALINMNGEIIGINSAMYSSGSASGGSSAGSVGLGFAIPVNTVKADLDTLRSGSGA